LLVWQDVAIVKSGVTGVAHTWAPEWLLGDDVVKVVANIDTGNGDFKPYAFTPLNSGLTSWSGPTPLGIGPNYIDTCVVKSAGTYHAFTKNETTRYLEHAIAPGLTGPWTFVGTGDWAGLGAGGFEGPTIVKLDDGTWRMYLDPQTRGVPCTYMNSRDLNTWSAPARLPGVPSEPMDAHGVPAAAAEAMAFSLLGRNARLGLPNHLPRCTGAAGPRVLGELVPGASGRL
jgi:hypothetical protein